MPKHPPKITRLEHGGTLSVPTGQGKLRSRLWRAFYRNGSGHYDRLIRGLFGYCAHDHVAHSYARLADPGAGPILDIGCGTGLCGEALAGLVDAEVDGTDLAAEMLVLARAKGLYRGLFAADITRPLPVPDGAYGGAVCAGVFTEGHVGEAALAPVLAALRPNAVFVFTVLDQLWAASFGACIAELEGMGRLAVLEQEPLRHFRAVKQIGSQLVAVRVCEER